MAKNISMNGNNAFLFGVLIAAIICPALLCLRFEKEEPSPVKDDDRIQVHIVTDTLESALKSRAGEWGSYDSEWSPNIFSREAGGFVIEALPQQKFYEILTADSAAARIARDYPHLFSFGYTDEGACRFRMARQQGFDGYVVVPTWLLVELVERNVLLIGHNK